MFNTPNGKPGMFAPYSAEPRDVFQGNGQFAQYVPLPLTIDGNLTAWPANTPYIWSIPAGTIMGKVTATAGAANGGQPTTAGKFANAILGLTSAALGGAQTTLNTDANTAAELVRRIGTSGTLTLTGPPVAAGVVRSKTITYSAVNQTTGAITISADASGAVSNVNAVYPFAVVDSTGSGTFTLTVEGITTAAITYSATYATLVTNINNALNAAFGTSAIVASATSLASIILTFSGTGYAARPIQSVGFTLLTGATGFTVNTASTLNVLTPIVATTAGVTAVAADEGEFISGSLIQPIDGSQVIISLICDTWGVKVVDQLNTTRVDIFEGKLLAAGGTINTGMLINYPTDTSLQAWVKSALKTNCNCNFHDVYI